MRVQLISENVDFNDLEFRLADKPLVLGRSVRADVQVAHSLISRLHCEWKQVNGELVLKDLESTNQTILNGEPIQQAPLQSGDRVLLGDLLYFVEIGDHRSEGPLHHLAEDRTKNWPIESSSPSEAPTTRLAVENVPTREK